MGAKEVVYKIQSTSSSVSKNLENERNNELTWQFFQLLPGALIFYQKILNLPITQCAVEGYLFQY